MTTEEAIEKILRLAHEAKPYYDRGTECDGFAALSFIRKMFPEDYDHTVIRHEAGQSSPVEYFTSMSAIIRSYSERRSKIRIDRLLCGTADKTYRGFLFASDYWDCGGANLLPFRNNPFNVLSTNKCFGIIGGEINPELFDGDNITGRPDLPF